MAAYTRTGEEETGGSTHAHISNVRQPFANNPCGHKERLSVSSCEQGTHSLYSGRSVMASRTMTAEDVVMTDVGLERIQGPSRIDCTTPSVGSVAVTIPSVKVIQAPPSAAMATVCLEGRHANTTDCLEVSSPMNELVADMESQSSVLSYTPHLDTHRQEELTVVHAQQAHGQGHTPLSSRPDQCAIRGMPYPNGTKHRSIR